MKNPVCVVVGIGPGTALARRFTAGGYAVALMARGGARSYECDVADAASVKNAFARVSADLGAGGL
jgi:NAD(P)-dependent dehydrogenase (short-subunit alcohol dehydrogenase family)